MEYTKPKIHIDYKIVNGKKIKYVGKGSKWYIWFRFRNPETGEMKQFKVYNNLNRIKGISERLKTAKKIQRVLENHLAQGFSPFSEKESELNFNKEYNIIDAIDKAVEKKSKVWSASYIHQNKHQIDYLKEFLSKNKLDHLPAKSITKKHMIYLFEHISKKNLSAYSYNNYRKVYLSLTNQMMQDEIIDKNFMIGIEKLPEKAVKNESLTDEQVNKLKKYLQENDTYLLTYIQFLTYSFLRPIEITRIKIGDINLKERTIKVQTKTEKISVIYIIDKLIELIEKMDIQNYPDDYYLFSKSEKPDTWITTREKSKADFFSYRFLKVKRDLNLGDNYGIYSFRHTFIKNLYFSFLNQGLPPIDAKNKLITITRHTTIKTLDNYLRNIGAYLPEDYSKDFTIDF
ncbi:tyrosine-type recombinase/integrase [Aureivirga marina]|uniref:tyrosine-type recombinase/integrase n=1 Tax=Aureivirga marina TaxID=1182451 RepID=UPI0018C9D42B|nr:tyrosine-type recombinase/integrase [Aureivirga marina]